MWTNGGLYRVLSGALNLSTATLKAMLLDVAYVPDPDHEFIAALSPHELSGTGYVGGFAGSGRKTLAGKVFAKDNATDCATFDATDPVWAAADFGTAGYLAIVQEVTDDTQSPVIATIPLGGVTALGGSFTVQFGAFALKLRAV